MDPIAAFDACHGHAGYASRFGQTFLGQVRPADADDVPAGSSSIPLPEPRSILVGLADKWEHWSGEVGCPGELPATGYSDVRVTDLELRSVSVDWQQRQGGRRRASYVVSGSVGWLRLHCPQRDLAARVDALLGLAEFAGIGGYTGRGLGVPRDPPRRSDERGRVAVGGCSM